MQTQTTQFTSVNLSKASKKELANAGFTLIVLKPRKARKSDVHYTTKKG